MRGMPSSPPHHALPAIQITACRTIRSNALAGRRLRVENGREDHGMGSGMIRIATDIGGTFTDIAIDTGARVLTGKLLTTPSAPENAVAEGVGRLLAEAGIDPGAVGLFLHGTTLATNAVIERKGARTALITTAGFTDTLEIAREHRFDQYNLFLERPLPLVPRGLRFGAAERVDADGRVLTPLGDAEIDRLAGAVREAGAASAAICLLHSYANPVHERRIAARFAEVLPGLPLSLSVEVSPVIGEYERTSTTVANAYVQPLVGAYLVRMRERLSGMGLTAPILVMMSEGGLASVETASRFPVRLIESGPAGGAMFAAAIARRLGKNRLLAFDMGGTTAKLCLIEDGQPQYETMFEADRVYRFKRGSGLPLRIPVVDLVEIGAGGGSIAQVDGVGRLQVGPESAASEPGPACYGRGGVHPTVTDANLLLGRILPARFAGGRLPLNPAAADTAIAAEVAAPLGLSPTEGAAAVAEVVEEAMASAARTYAAEKGKDVSGCVLLAFGGAGGLHAARLARKLGVTEVIVPPHAGVGSAIGFLVAPCAYSVKRSIFARLTDVSPDSSGPVWNAMRAEARGVLGTVPATGPLIESWTADMRYVGQGAEVTLPFDPREENGATTLGDGLRTAFEETYRLRFGRLPARVETEVAAWTLTLRVDMPAGDVLRAEADSLAMTGPEPHRLYDLEAGGEGGATVLERASLVVGQHLDGPALIVEDDTTTLVAAGMTACRDAAGFLYLRRAQPAGDA
jgi:N-methylhydantoinase A/oxoprolinase/acetone carboxylase beta subunit